MVCLAQMNHLIVCVCVSVFVPHHRILSAVRKNKNEPFVYENHRVGSVRACAYSSSMSANNHTTEVASITSAPPLWPAANSHHLWL